MIDEEEKMSDITLLNMKQVMKCLRERQGRQCG